MKITTKNTGTELFLEGSSLRLSRIGRFRARILSCFESNRNHRTGLDTIPDRFDPHQEKLKGVAEKVVGAALRQIQGNQHDPALLKEAITRTLSIKWFHVTRKEMDALRKCINAQALEKLKMVHRDTRAVRLERRNSIAEIKAKYADKNKTTIDAIEAQNAEIDKKIKEIKEKSEKEVETKINDLHEKEKQASLSKKSSFFRNK